MNLSVKDFLKRHRLRSFYRQAIKPPADVKSEPCALVDRRKPVRASRRGFIAGAIVVLTAAAAPLPGFDDAYAAYLPVTRPSWNALDYGVVGDGVTNDTAAINGLFSAAATAGAAVWFPGNLTYNTVSGQLVVPPGSVVVASATATFLRSADPGSAGTTWPNYYGTAAGAMISAGSNVQWTGGVFNNTAQLATSNTTFTPTVTGAQVITLNASGLNIAAGNFIRVQSASTPSAHLEGVVNSYSGTSLSINVQFANGGSHNDWVVYSTGVWHAPFTFDNVSNSSIDLVQIKGAYYVGIIVSAWNPSTGGTRITTECFVKRCFAFGIFNRPFYTYGAVSHVTFDTCIVDGNNGGTDYAYNMNPANATGTVNAQQFNSYVNCRAINCSFQAFAIGDLCFYVTITSPIVNNVSNTATNGVGILIQVANNGGTNRPQYVNITNPEIVSCNIGIELIGALYVNITGGSVIACGTGFTVVAAAGPINSAECSWQDMLVQGCTGVGVNIAANQVNTLVTGRSVSNGTNLADAGTGTIKTQLYLT